jgi:putative addiction module component (TIGR02574 family)
MSETAQAILAAIHSLSAAERTEIADALLEYTSEPEDLGPPEDWVEMSEEEFRAELDRRIEEVRNGTDPGIPAEEVMRELSEIVDAKSKT